MSPSESVIALSVSVINTVSPSELIGVEGHVVPTDDDKGSGVEEDRDELAIDEENKNRGGDMGLLGDVKDCLNRAQKVAREDLWGYQLCCYHYSFVGATNQTFAASSATLAAQHVTHGVSA